jgi:hypothetical protein
MFMKRSPIVIAAIYARRVQTKTGVADEQKSVTRQVKARASVRDSTEWPCAYEHVYVTSERAPR